MATSPKTPAPGLQKPQSPARNKGVARPEVVQKKDQVKGRLDDEKEQHQKKVWDKLDQAKKQAAEKSHRIKGFSGPGS